MGRWVPGDPKKQSIKKKKKARTTELVQVRHDRLDEGGGERHKENQPSSLALGRWMMSHISHCMASIR